MAIPNYQALGTQFGGTGALTPTWPPTHAIDDIGFMVMETANEPPTLSDPQGFVAVTNVGQGVAGAAGSCGMWLWWCRATIANGMPAPTVADPGDHMIGRIFTVRGAETSGNPWHLITSDTLLVADTVVTIPGQTTTLAECLVLLFVANAIDLAASQTSGYTNADLGGVTERFDSNTSSGVGGGVGMASGTKAAAGTYGGTAASLINTSKQARLTIAIQPPQGAVTGTVRSRITVVSQALGRSASW